MKNLKILFLAIFSLFFTYNLCAISFSGLTLSNDDRLLFKTEFNSRDALYVSALSSMAMQQLTTFPEKMHLVDNGRTLLIVNRFGASRIPVIGGLPSPLPVYPSFSSGSIPLRGRVQEILPSNDGRWILYVEPTSPAHGNLLLIELSTGTKRVVSERIELPASDFPAVWSPDSRLFVYAKGGNLYYLPILNDLSVLTDERLRMIGPGEISSVCWGTHGDFYYFVGNTLYRIINPELFTRTIYGDFLSVGRVAAVLPLEFIPGFDRFWIAPDSGAVLVNKNNKGFYIFSLGENQNPASVLPHAAVPDGMEDFSVFWNSTGRPSDGSKLTIIASSKNQTTVWRFDTIGGLIRNSTSMNVPSSLKGMLSPDGTKIAFFGENGIELWDYANWRLIQKLTSEPVYSCAWNGSDRLISGNAKFIEEININDREGRTRLICLSSADEAGFEDIARGSPRILAKVGTEWFATDGRNSWMPSNNPSLRAVSLATERFRVFMETRSTGHFKNVPMIRNANATGTFSLVQNHSAGSAFTLGRPMQIALCFDVYDDDTGLFQVLAALRRHNIRATFFLNGDFIRRSPYAASAIAQAGHQTASLFYAPIDFSDARYRITRDFITQGLARNEDEFFQATGKELSLLWHPPYYRNSDFISSTASSAGYFTVTRTIDPGDWLSREDALRLNLRQLPPSQIIDQITERKTSGAVIPVRIGLITGGRSEYLFQRIDVLLDALIRSGCEIVPVSAVTGR